MKRVIFLCAVFLTGCDLPWDAGPQPSSIERNEYRRRLNILGIIRPGTNASLPLSFVHVERTYDMYHLPDSLEVGDAQVQILSDDGISPVDTINLQYTNFAGLFARAEYRSELLSPDAEDLAGQIFGLVCRRTGFPELTADTEVPLVPQIVDDTVHVSGDRLYFEILRDARAGAYDVFLHSGGSELSARFLRPESGNTYIEMETAAFPIAQVTITIYAYDLNLSEYIDYNIIIKPQTYQSTFSTVEGGYGCFGSLNVLTRSLSL